MLNAFYGKKKIVVVNINNNQIAKDIAEELRAEGFSNVSEIEAPKNYPGYYRLAESDPAYTIMVEESASCSVKPCKISGFAGDRLGHYVSRNLTESQDAKKRYSHHLKMIGLNPKFIGSHGIPFEDVKEILWYWQDKTPLLYAKLPNEEKVPKAVCEAIKDYFRK